VDIVTDAAWVKDLMSAELFLGLRPEVAIGQEDFSSVNFLGKNALSESHNAWWVRVRD
jgi:hypothetical protein